MKKRVINENEIIVNINNRYFVVNDYTYKLLDFYYSNNDINKLSKALNMSKREVKKTYGLLKKEIDNVDYYENNIDLDFPLKIQWRITNKCNLKCMHCYLGDLNNQELSSEQLRTIANKIAKSNVMEVTLTGGEALLVESLPDIVKLFIDADIVVNVFSNGVLLEKFEQIVSEKLGYLPVDKLNFFISIDGLKESHNKIRGKSIFDNVINNIKNIVLKGYNVTTNTVVSSINYEDIPQLYELLYKIGVHKIQISNLIISGNANENMVITKKMKDDMMNNLKKVLATLDNGAKLLYAEMPDEGESSNVYMVDKENKTYLQKENWKCSAGIGKATIDYDGLVYCCPFIKSKPLGNLKDEDINDIWNSKARFDLLKILATNNNNSRVCIAVKNKSLL